ncbi:MAG: phospho-N-acetylmuramoyl-pentapeptide-transferase [Tissierellales bacterium]
MWRYNIILFFISAIFSFIVIPFIYDLLRKNNCTSLNYRNQNTPIGMGLVFVLVQSFVIITFVQFKNNSNTFNFFYIFSIQMIALIGVIDDLIGEKEVKGFRGHIYSLFNLRLTTGGLKLIIGGVVGLLVSLTLSKNPFELIVNILIIGLFTNLINLFDLRPGRACKVFIVFSILMIFSAMSKEYNYIITSLMGNVLVYIPYDLKAKSMMGDAGSNVLGMTLGVFCAATQSISIKIVYLIVIVIIHVVSEFRSLTEIIDNNKVLCYIDKLGR